MILDDRTRTRSIATAGIAHSEFMSRRGRCPVGRAADLPRAASTRSTAARDRFARRWACAWQAGWAGRRLLMQAFWTVIGPRCGRFAAASYRGMCGQSDRC